MLRSVLAVITGFVVIVLLALGSDAIARSIARTSSDRVGRWATSGCSS